MSLTDIGRRYSAQFRDRKFLWSLVVAFVFLVAALAVNMLAGIYASERATGWVGDIVLSNIPVFDVDAIFVYGPIVFWAIVSLYCLHDPKKIPFWLKSVALFIVVRSVFITLTHIGPFPDRFPVDSLSLGANINLFIFSSGADLFFSGHTGLPFLTALIFWDNRLMRVFCIMASIFFGVVVLLGHLHYSIDVLAAFFITYSIYHIAMKIFPWDLRRLKGASAAAPEPAKAA